MINSKDISIVVQGAIDKIETPKCLKSIRKYLPYAEIILSTWEGSDISNLDFDEVIYNKDPGNAIIRKHCNSKVCNNLNRQLLSTKEGLKKIKRKYAMKLRSDLILSGNSFLNYFDEFQNRTEDYKLFQRKIIVPTLFTRYNIRNNSGKTKIPFHISDWWFFGLTEDLKTYFMDTPLVKEPEFTDYFKLPENQNKKNPYAGANFKFAPEQYFGYKCFERNFSDIYMEDASNTNDELFEIFEKCLANNFIVLEFKQSGIYLNKYLYSKNEKFAGDQYVGLYNFYRYEETYKRICNNNYKITFNDCIYKNEKYWYDFLRIQKHIFILFDPKAKFLKKLEQIFIGIPFSSFLFVVKHPKEIFQSRKRKLLY